MNRFFSADIILTVSGANIICGAIETDEQGTIINIYQNINQVDPKHHIEFHKGIIVPGLVNAHCHLELSHMKDKIDQKTGLVSFIKDIMKKRNDSDEVISRAMVEADQVMQKNGIVAVGDHANTLQSIAIKKESALQYLTFIELLGIDQNLASQIYKEGVQKRERFLEAGLAAELSPHAPYSVSRELFRLIKKYENYKNVPLSMHNQESDEENKLFKSRSGQFLDFYKTIGMDIEKFPIFNNRSLSRTALWLPTNRKIQLVHNTFTGLKDMSMVYRRGYEVYWCLCPNANVYIENQLPNIQYFTHYPFNITIGTDSLASNAQLCILSELKTLRKHFPTLDLKETIRWATLNGAEFLGLEAKLGSLDIGKKPGLVLIENVEHEQLTNESTCKRLI